MLDLMEIRGFSVLSAKNRRQYLLVTPDRVSFAVQLFPHLSDIESAFACFESINSNYP